MENRPAEVESAISTFKKSNEVEFVNVPRCISANSNHFGPDGNISTAVRWSSMCLTEVDAALAITQFPPAGLHSWL